MFREIRLVVSATRVKYQPLLPLLPVHETEKKTLKSLVPLGLIRAFQGWFRGFQGQRVGDPRPCPNCGETTIWKNGYRTDRLFAILITEDGFEEVTPSRFSVISALSADIPTMAISRSGSTRTATTPNQLSTSARFMLRRIRSTHVNGFSKTSMASRLTAIRSRPTPSGSATSSPTATASRSLALPS